MRTLFLVLFISAGIAVSAQSDTDMKAENLPYHQIPDYPESYTAGTLLGRTIDGLGYRYYWATKDLRDYDLNYVPGNDGRGTKGTLDHLFGLSRFILNAAMNKPNVRPSDPSPETWPELRKATLENFKKTSDILKSSTVEQIESYEIVFKRGDNESSFPFWNMLNGPMADAIYHVGQIVSFRRSAGNPIHPGVSVFTGKTDESK